MEYTIIIPTLESKQNKDRDKSAFVSRRNSKCENRSLHRLLRDVDQPQISAERFWLVFEALLKAGGRDRDTRAFTCRNMHKHTLVSYRTFMACLYDKSPCDCHIIDSEDLACMHLFQKNSTTGESWKHPTIFLFQTVQQERFDHHNHASISIPALHLAYGPAALFLSSSIFTCLHVPSLIALYFRWIINPQVAQRVFRQGNLLTCIVTVTDKVTWE